MKEKLVENFKMSIKNKNPEPCPACGSADTRPIFEGSVFYECCNCKHHFKPKETTDIENSPFKKRKTEHELTEKQKELVRRLVNSKRDEVVIMEMAAPDDQDLIYLDIYRDRIREVEKELGL